MISLPKVAIIELGSQYTLLIERTLRELGVRSAILTPKKALDYFKENKVKAVILSGGAASCYAQKAPQPPEEVLSLRGDNGQPVALLGICYGMQWLAIRFNGKVEAMPGSSEYGKAQIKLCDGAECLFLGTPTSQQVWMSHGDSVTVAPEGFKVLAYSSTDAIAAMVRGQVFGVQFHPEVKDTLYGKTILSNFLRLANCETDWTPSLVVSDIQDKVASQLGKKRAVIGFSGGVDSTTLSAILSPVLKERLLALTINLGNLRKGEIAEILENAQAAGVTKHRIMASRDLDKVMEGVIDAEQKRQLHKKAYSALLMQAAREFGAEAVIQGTLAPDRIESGATGGAVIKSHHNVGLDMGNLMQLHPIDRLFKYEVRALSCEIGLPESVWKRQPFPGPGLFLRVVGVPATSEKIAIVRWADAKTREILKRHKIYNELSQLVVAYVGVNTVGVKGDDRVYGDVIVVRAVQTLDFMTAQGVHFSEEIEDEIESELTRHPEIVRVWFDPTDKPPATTELE